MGTIPGTGTGMEGEPRSTAFWGGRVVIISPIPPPRTVYCTFSTNEVDGNRTLNRSKLGLGVLEGV